MTNKFRQIMQDIAQALIDPVPHYTALDHIKGGAPMAQERLQVYQNNIFMALSEALAAIYSSVVRVFGSEEFQGLAIAYLRLNPQVAQESRSLIFMGKNFPDFLSEYFSSDYPFITDLAKMDLAYHESYHSLDSPILDPKNLNHIHDYGCLAFIPHPSLRLVPISYDLLVDWQGHENLHAYAPRQLPAISGIAFVRPELTVQAYEFSGPSWTLLQNLYQGMSLETAADDFDQAEDLSSVLSLFLQHGFFCDVKTLGLDKSS